MKAKKTLAALCIGLAVVSCVVLIWQFYAYYLADLPAEEIVFIPGWQTEFDSPEHYEKYLKTIFPKAAVTVLKWKSSCSWDQAKSNASDFVREVVKYIAGKPVREQRRIILVGHSLGGRIAAESAPHLAKKRIKIQQFILMGTAMDWKSDLKVIPSVSEGVSINIFCRNDDALKIVYNNAEGHLAAGFCGLNDPPAERFRQYESQVADSNRTIGVKIINHTAETYFAELKLILDGKRVSYRRKFDYSRVELGWQPVPDRWFIPLDKFDHEVLETFADWKLVKVFRRKKTDSNVNENWASAKWDEVVEYIKDNVLAIADHNGRIVQWSVAEAIGIPSLKIRWLAIKSQIRELPSPQNQKDGVHHK